MFNKIRNLKEGIRNIIEWFPVIYEDRWWDYSFLYSILRKKLSLMEKGFREDGICLNSEKDAKKMKICVLLLDRLINDDYIDYGKDNGLGPNIRILMDKEDEMIEQDLDLLFKIMRKQIRSWWD